MFKRFDFGIQQLADGGHDKQCDLSMQLICRLALRYKNVPLLYDSFGKWGLILIILYEINCRKY